MHLHAYLWTGAKERFDQEALRRPPHPAPPPAGSNPELIQRYREVAAGFPTVDLPPLETAYWLIKPRSLIRGTWDEAKDAAAWVRERLADHAHRFACTHDRNAARLAMLVESAAERLDTGADVSFGFYLERPSYLHLAMVACSPNRSMPHLPCPLA